MALPNTSAWWQNWRTAVGQSAISGQISPDTATQAVYGGALADIQARYDTEAQRQNLALQGRQVAVSEKAETAREGEYASTLAQRQSEFSTTSGLQERSLKLESERLGISEDQLKAQKKAEMVQGITAGVGVGAYAIPKIAPYAKDAYNALTYTSGYTGVPAGGQAIVGPGASLAESGYTGAGLVGAGEGLAGAGAAVGAAEIGAGGLGAAGVSATGAGLAFESGGAAAFAGAEASAEAGSLIATEATVGAELGPYGWAAAAVAIGVTVAVNETIVCTEVHRQGAIDDSTRRSASKYSRMVSRELYQGYLMVFGPVVRLMQKSTLASKILIPIGVAFSMEVAHRANPSIKGSRFGSLLITIFKPVCIATHWIRRKTLLIYDYPKGA